MSLDLVCVSICGPLDIALQESTFFASLVVLESGLKARVNSVCYILVSKCQLSVSACRLSASA